MDLKKLQGKLTFLLALIAGAFLVLVLRLGILQIVEVAKYQTQAKQNHQRLIPITPPRGEIIDRNGERIVGNKPVYTVSITYLGQKDTDSIVNTLSKLLVGEKAFQGKSIEGIKAELKDKIQAQKLRLYEPVHVAVGVSLETVAKIEERRLDLPGVVIDIEPVRDYPQGDLMAPVLGYVGEIEKEQLKKNKDKDYRMGDNFGKTGLENQYEEALRGKRGARLVEVDAQGRPVRDLGVETPSPGNNLILTVDSRLQRAAQDALAKGIANARVVGGGRIPRDKALSATAVVEDVRTGEVLAMVSLPSYDGSLFSGGISVKEYNDLIKTGALRNNAVETTYIPGSVFKMVTATSILEGGIIKPETTIFDPGYYKTQLDWKPGGHGVVDIRRALQVSCDTFFYMFGAKAGPELMNKYAKEYGLGEKTGIDLPGEEPGQLSTRERKKQSWPNNPWESEWHEYDSTNMAIGQGDTKCTGLQLANYVSVIANGGTLYKPYIVQKITTQDNQSVATMAPQVIRRLNVSADTLKIIQEGMHMVTLKPEGTAAGVFAGAAYQAAAKTGTAEVGDAQKNKHALFVAYAPYENPEIAVSVIIEYGGMGSGVAGPVARNILDAYFDIKNNPQEKNDDTSKNSSGQATPGQSTGSTTVLPDASQSGSRTHVQSGQEDQQNRGGQQIPPSGEGRQSATVKNPPEQPDPSNQGSSQSGQNQQEQPLSPPAIIESPIPPSLPQKNE